MNQDEELMLLLEGLIRYSHEEQIKLILRLIHEMSRNSIILFAYYAEPIARNETCRDSKHHQLSQHPKEMYTNTLICEIKYIYTI